MKRYLYILIAACVAVGCTKDDTSLGGTSTLDPNAVNFSGSADNWGTKSSIYDEDENPITEMEVFAYYTADKEWSSTSSSDILRFMTNQKVTKSGNTWSYTPLRYWPTAAGQYDDEGDNNKITFYAFAPYGEITASGDEGCHTFGYVMSSLAQENEDLVAAVTLDNTIDDGGVKLAFDHTLTKIGLQVQLKGECEEDDDYDDVSYTMYGVSFHGLYNNSTLSIADNGSFTWSTQAADENITNTSTVELVATQGSTLIATSKAENLINNKYNSETETNNYLNVMPDDQAIFVLPQYLSSANRATAPTVSVRILKTYTYEDDYKELIYESQEVEIPAISGYKGWEAGQSITYSVTFDIENLSESYTPMTLTSEIYEWTEVEVSADVHSNLYIYSSLSKIAMQTDDDDNNYGEFMICTNYDYNMRVPHHRVELDGEITSSRGFVFCTDDFPDDDTYDAGNLEVSGYENYKIFVPTLLSVDDEGVTRKIKYATEDDVTSLLGHTIYRYTNGYNDESSREEIFTDATVKSGHNGYIYVLDGDYYRLLYLDPKESNALTAFNYTTDFDSSATDHEIQLSNFANDEGMVSFMIEISDDYSFDFTVMRSTRTQEEMYVTTAIDGSDNSYGVNKEGDDAVYVLRLSVDTSHLSAYNDYSFNDIIGAELISNGGGMVTQYFSVTLYTEDSSLAK